MSSASSSSSTSTTTDTSTPVIYYGQSTIEINAPFTIVWEALVQKIYHPDKYVPGIVKVDIVKDSTAQNDEETLVERRMWTAEGREIHENIYRRNIENNGKLVDFVMLDNPVVTGNVFNAAYPLDDGKRTSITYTLKWTRRNDAPENAPAPIPGGDPQAAIIKAVTHMKMMVEQSI